VCRSVCIQVRASGSEYNLRLSPLGPSPHDPSLRPLNRFSDEQLCVNDIGAMSCAHREV
jgi:hypothetical protein